MILWKLSLYEQFLEAMKMYDTEIIVYDFYNDVQEAQKDYELIKKNHPKPSGKGSISNPQLTILYSDKPIRELSERYGYIIKYGYVLVVDYEQ